MSDLLRVLVVLALVAGNALFGIGEYAVVTAIGILTGAIGEPLVRDLLGG